MMFVEVTGNADGPALLLVHGFLSSNVQWDLNRAELARHFRLILVELPGHGASPSPVDPSGYGLEALAVGFERIRVELQIDRWWVCGQSLGGAIAIGYALAHPDRVQGLAFTNSRAAFGIGRTGVSDQRAVASAVASVRDLPVHPANATRLPEAIKDRMVRAADAMAVDTVNQYLSRRHTWDTEDRLPELAMPVLLINGRWEKAFQPYVAVAERAIPRLQVVTLEGGHAINVEQADAFNAALIAFALDST